MSITPPAPPSNTIANTTTLGAIEQKVRRLVRNTATAQLSQVDLDNYINTAVIYDFPETLRTFNLRTTFTFFANPGQDVYPTDIASFGGNPSAVNNPLYNFQNKYLTIHPPVYCAGYQLMYTQSQEHFWGIYPLLNSISSISQTGNGVATNFVGTINSQQSIVPPGLTQQISLIQNNVLFSAIGTNGEGLALADVPVIDPLTGNPTNIGNLYNPYDGTLAAAQANPPIFVNPGNTINYLTGVFNITFSSAPAANTPINSQTIPTQRSMPQAMLFFHNQFTLRPVPDQPYRIYFEVYQRPTALLANNQSPELEEYWQFIAYLAAKKALEEHGDLDTVALIMPELKNQEALCLRRTIVQLTNERTATIYAENLNGPWGWNGWGGGAGGMF